jgi:hypothetical protein
VFAVEIVNNGRHWGNTAQAFAQWWHSVASSEDLDVLHWSMCPTSYCCIRMVIKTASNLLAFCVIIDFV